MSAKSNNNGRAYEYVTLLTLHKEIEKLRPCVIVRNSSFEAASNAWNSLELAHQNLYSLSAQSTVGLIFALEPNITEPTEDILELYIQPDSKGKDGDVRDIILCRGNVRWEVGLSIKHNHMAVKHSRLSSRLDFGTKWYGVACSKEYWEAVTPVFDFLKKEKRKGTLFGDLADKEDRVYVPLLNAFMNEVSRRVEENEEVPRRLVEYLLSRYDFYKIISFDKKRLTTIQSFNMYGTLNQPSGKEQPALEAPRLPLPEKLLCACLKPGSKTTAILSFDNGWQFSFRIHNAEDRVVPSLKFDVQIVGMPMVVNVKFDCKW